MTQLLEDLLVKIVLNNLTVSTDDGKLVFIGCHDDELLNELSAHKAILEKFYLTLDDERLDHAMEIAALFPPITDLETYTRHVMRIYLGNFPLNLFEYQLKNSNEWFLFAMVGAGIQLAQGQLKQEFGDNLADVRPINHH